MHIAGLSLFEVFRFLLNKQFITFFRGASTLYASERNIHYIDGGGGGRGYDQTQNLYCFKPQMLCQIKAVADKIIEKRSATVS
jgi:hypothetical protein